MSSRKSEPVVRDTDLALFTHNQRQNLQEYSRSPSHNGASSTSLAELLNWVEEVHSGSHSPTSMVHRSRSTPMTPPFILAFNNLTYSVNIGRKLSFPSMFGWKRASEVRGNKVLLNDISGEAKEGEILAVLGASGSGKSTLIDALANRISKGSLGGSVALNGEVLESKLLKVISAYVMQDDLLYPMLTVEETLMFSAEFHLPQSLSKKKKFDRVQTLIDQLGLRNVTNTVIGDEGHRGVSGGERRRVSIGTDIIHDPIVLFLDEPTSGLDSTSAFMVVKVLKNIAQTGSIVIMSVHQPSYRILSLLDRLIFLSRGKTAFSGPPGTLPEFFAKFGHPIPENENWVEFALDLIRELEQSPNGTQPLIKFNKSWQKETRNDNQAHHVGPMSLRDAINAAIFKGKLVSGSSSFANPYWVEMFVISKRSIINSMRSPELFGIRFMVVLVTGAILATIFHNLDESPKGVQERLGFFAFAMSTMYYTCAETITVFLQERYIFMRETAYNAYRRSSYVIAHSIISLPALIILSLTFAGVTFWPVRLAGGTSGFLFYFLAILASFWAGSSFVMFFSSVLSRVVLGVTVVVAILSYFILFSGFFITRDRIPLYWIWFHYLSLVKYPFNGVMQNEFDDDGVKCFVRGVQMFDNTPLGDFPAAMKVKLLKNMGDTLGMNITVSTCVMNGIDVLKMQGITDISKWNCLGITVAWGFFFRVLFYFGLLLGSKNKRT